MSGRITSLAPDQSVVGYPLLGSSFYYFDLTTQRIVSLLTYEPLEAFADDRGFYNKLVHPYLKPMWEYLLDRGIGGFLFCSPSYEETNKFTVLSVYNKIYVYDLYDGKDEPINPHKSKAIWDGGQGILKYKALSKLPKLLEPTIFHLNEVNKIYQAEDQDQLYFGGPKFPLGMAIRPLDSIAPLYLLYDPYGQWSSPKFVNNLEFTKTMPGVNDVNKLMASILDSVDWDLAAASIPKDKPLDIKWVCSSIFDVLYFNTLYYSIAKSLWIDSSSKTDDFTQALMGNDKDESVVINFTQLIKQVIQRVKEELKTDDWMTAELENDINSIQDVRSTETVTDSIEDPDVDWLFN